MLTNKNSYHTLVENYGVEYYSVKGMEKLRNEMLRLLKIINNICIENNISYWLDGGSAIGVIRHKGFIPWDDDLDISLLKDDYLKLIDRLQEYCDSHNDCFLFFEPKQRWHCVNYLASTKVYFRCYGSTELVPIKVDIRPVNGFVNSEEEKEKNLKLRDTANYILFERSSGYVSTKDIQQMSFQNKEIFFLNYNNKYGLYLKDDAVLAHPYFEFSNEIPLNVNDFLPIVYLDFEDIKVPVPHEYDKLLTILYGDYMKMPPLDNRAPVACEVFERNISMRDIRKLLSLMFFEKVCLSNKIKALLLSIRRIGIFKYFRIKLTEK